MIVGLVAVDKNQGIGFNNSMPWPHLSEDLRWFKRVTNNNVVLMGSNTWKSIGKYLPDRINVVVSSQLVPDADLTFSDPRDAVKELSERYGNKNICIIGGQALYDSVRDLVDTYYITEIDHVYECDRFFDVEYVKENYKTVENVLAVEATDQNPAYIIKEYKK